jgi:hypothetical protein
MATTHSDELSHSPASSRVIAIIICSLNNKYTIIILSLIYIQGNSRVMMSQTKFVMQLITHVPHSFLVCVVIHYY